MGCREAKNYRDNVVQVHPSIINSIVQLTAVCLLWVPELHPTPPHPPTPLFSLFLHMFYANNFSKARYNTHMMKPSI